MNRTRATLAALLCLLAPATVRAEDAGPQWDAAFPSRAAPERVHFLAGYLDGAGRAHRLEVWRDADLRLRRKTDHAIELYVEKSPSGEYEYRLIDRNRHVLIRADRTALYRIGVFSDWAGLAHVIEIPRGRYRVTQTRRRSAASLRGECAWQRLERIAPAASITEICWSSRWGLPLEIGMVSGQEGWKSVFWLEAVETFVPSPEIFALPPHDLLELDAGPDEEVSD